METSVNLPHIPSRRGGDDQVTHILDDIFTVLTHLDENLSLGMLPRYVTDNLDSVPSSRLYEGDLSTLMKVIERMDNEIKDLRLVLDIVVKNTQHRSTATANRAGCDRQSTSLWSTSSRCAVWVFPCCGGSLCNDVRGLFPTARKPTDGWSWKRMS